MMKIKVRNSRWLFLLLFTAFAANVASATPVPTGYGSHLDQSAITFYNTVGGDAFAEVKCDVYYDYTSGPYAGKYVYTYEVSNDSSSGISLFMVALKDGSDAQDADYDDTGGGVLPGSYSVAGSPAQSVNYAFYNTIPAGSDSCILWFVSDYAPELNTGAGALVSVSSGMPVFATGDLITPIPEPTMIALLGFGTAFVLRRKKQSSC